MQDKLPLLLLYISLQAISTFITYLDCQWTHSSRRSRTDDLGESRCSLLFDKALVLNLHPRIQVIILVEPGFKSLILWNFSFAGLSGVSRASII